MFGIFRSAGLFLFYVGSQMKTKHLCLLFGIVPFTAKKIIDKMLHLACRKLKNHEISKKTFPGSAMMQHFAAMVQSREPMIENVIGFVDGLSLPI